MHLLKMSPLLQLLVYQMFRQASSSDPLVTESRELLDLSTALDLQSEGRRSFAHCYVQSLKFSLPHLSPGEIASAFCRFTGGIKYAHCIVKSVSRLYYFSLLRI